VVFREFNYLFERAEPAWPPAVASAAPTAAARKAPSGGRRVRSPRCHSYRLSNGW
jgi:hypothetical protein